MLRPKALRDAGGPGTFLSTCLAIASGCIIAISLSARQICRAAFSRILAAWAGGNLVSKEIKWAQLRPALKRVEAAPSLRRINGWGCSLVGKFKDDHISPY